MSRIFVKVNFLNQIFSNEGMEEKLHEMLGKYLKIKKNVRAFSSLLIRVSENESSLKRNLFETCHCLKNKESVKKVYVKLANEEFGSNSKIFEEFRMIQEEQDDFMTSPAEVEEGVLECGKCGGKRTISFSLQTRSGDEATSVWARCVECGNRWRE